MTVNNNLTPGARRGRNKTKSIRNKNRMMVSVLSRRVDCLE